MYKPGLTLIAIVGVALSSCKEDAPKTGAMPGIQTGSYAPPTSREASEAYISGFTARYDISHLDYPQDVKDRIRKVRKEKLKKNAKLMRANMKLVQMAANKLSKSKGKDVEESRKLYDRFLKSGGDVSSLDDRSFDQIIDALYEEKKASRPSSEERQASYDKTVKAYKKAYRTVTVEKCRWTEMKKLIGSGHEEMAYIYKTHPSHAYQCDIEMTTERRKGYPRLTNFISFFSKSESGEWQYYGTFPQVRVAPRRQFLNPDILKNPERAAKRLSFWEIDV